MLKPLKSTLKRENIFSQISDSGALLVCHSPGKLAYYVGSMTHDAREINVTIKPSTSESHSLLNVNNA